MLFMQTILYYMTCMDLDPLTASWQQTRYMNDHMHTLHNF